MLTLEVTVNPLLQFFLFLPLFSFFLPSIFWLTKHLTGIGSSISAKLTNVRRVKFCGSPFVFTITDGLSITPDNSSWERFSRPDNGSNFRCPHDFSIGYDVNCKDWRCFSFITCFTTFSCYDGKSWSSSFNSLWLTNSPKPSSRPLNRSLPFLSPKNLVQAFD